MTTTAIKKAESYLAEKHRRLWIAMKHHRTHEGKMMNFKDNPFLYGIYADDNPYLVVIKSTQNGLTEYLIVREIDEAMNEGRSIFHVLPSIQLIGRFVKNRIDRSIGFSSYYKSIAHNSPKDSDAMSLKHYGKGTVAYVGSNSTSAFAEFPAQTVIVDELDYCDQEKLSMAWERLSFAQEKRQAKIANPTIEDFGIDVEWKNTDQKEWNIKCDCGKYVKPDFFLHVLRQVDDNKYEGIDKDWFPDSGRDINMICHYCGRPLNRRGWGIWVPRHPGRQRSGYQISKLYTSNVKIYEIVDRFGEGLTSDFKMQRFYNADLGLPYSASGAKITRNDLNACRGEDFMPKEIKEGTACIAGADVGSKIHVRISQILPDNRLRAVYIGAVDTAEELIQLSYRYNVVCGVIDAMPETRLSRRVVATLPGWFMCFYNEVKREIIDPMNKIITVERTQTLDAVKEAVLTNKLVLPPNAEDLPEYYDHMTAATRVLDEKRMKYVWQEGSKPDHFHHAEGYCLLAQKLVVAVSR